jgi:hypothetical protein
MFSIDEVVTRKEVPVVFDDGNITASFPKDTQSMLLPEGSSGGLLEYLHFNPSNILIHPLIKDGAEENTQSFSRHGAVVHSTFFFAQAFPKA